MEMESCVPPGFRFHPTEEELVGYYLKRKIDSMKIDIQVIVDIDLYNMEPWDIQAKCKLGYDEQTEWYFFSHKDRKYPTGTRTNRATAAGFWKATGRDKAVLSKDRIIGMRKTLVFYKGRAPNGRKTDWIMHEYRLQTTQHGAPQEEGWVVCRAFKKPSPNQRPGFEAYSHAYHPNIINQTRPPTFSNLGAANLLAHPNRGVSFHQPLASDPELVSSNSFLENTNQIIELPQLDSPSTLSTIFAAKEDSQQFYLEDCSEARSNCSDQCMDWKNLNNLNTNDKTSYLHPTMPSISETFAIDGNHISHYLGCFPDL